MEIINPKWWNWKTTEFTLKEVCRSCEDGSEVPGKQGDFISTVPSDAFLAAILDLSEWKPKKINNTWVPDFIINWFEIPFMDYLDDLCNRVENNRDLAEVKLKDFDLKSDILNFLDYSMKNSIYTWELFEDYASFYLSIKGKPLESIDESTLKKLSKKYDWE